MENYSIKLELIVKHLTGEASLDEKQELLNWANENYANKKLYIQMKDIWEASHIDIDKRFEDQQAWRDFRSGIEEKMENERKEQRRMILMNILKVAAIIIITFGITWISLRSNNKDEVGIAKNQINVPRGSKTQVVLPDGSKVWVNSGSKIEYSSNFNDTSRIVNLTGEAYFDVVKNPQKPFVVKTGSLDVKAYGTIFNVKSYPDEDFVETILISGEVTVVRSESNKQIAKLIPNQKTIYYKEEGRVSFENKVKSAEKTPEQEKIVTIDPKAQMVLVETQPENFTAWKDQKLIFNSETFEEIVARLERWYGVNIHVVDEGIKNERFTGKFTHNEPLSQVLEAIKLTTHIGYEIKLNDVYISAKK